MMTQDKIRAATASPFTAFSAIAHSLAAFVNQDDGVEKVACTTEHNNSRHYDTLTPDLINSHKLNRQTQGRAPNAAAETK